MPSIYLPIFKQLFLLMLTLISLTQATETLFEHLTGASTIYEPNLKYEYLLGDPPESLPLRSLLPNSAQVTDGKSIDVQIKVEPRLGSRFILIELETQTLNWFTNDVSEVGDY